MVYEYYTFSYYHRVSTIPGQPTYIQDYDGWHKESIRDYELTEEEVMQYKRDGFLVVRNAIPIEIIDSLYDSIPSHSLSPYLHFFERWTLSITNSHFMFDHLWPTIDFFRDLWYFTPLIEYYVSPILNETQSLRLLTDHLFGIQNKPFSFGEYHQDRYAFNMVNGDSNGVSLWIPLMDINATHNGGSIHFINQSLVHSNYSVSFQRFHKSDVETKSILIDYFNKGDILIFSKFVIHRSQSLLKKDIMRYSYCGRIVDGENTFFKQTSGNKVMSKKHVCHHNIKNDQLLNTPCYPQLYPIKLINETQIIMDNKLEYPSNDVYFLFTVTDIIYNIFIDAFASQ